MVNIVSISGKQKRYLKGLSHNLAVVVTVGNKGLVDSVTAEIEQALAHHELIKIKLPAVEREKRLEMLHTICAATNADLVQSIGRIGVLYRPATTPSIVLPD